MALPQYQSGDNAFQLMQQAWATQINPLLANPANKSLLIRDIELATGVNVINHRLGRKQQGWIICDTQGTATVYRSADFNGLTLQLTASAPTTISLLVF